MQAFPSVPSLSIIPIPFSRHTTSGMPVFVRTPGIRSIYVVHSILSAFVHPLWFIVLSSFIARFQHHPTSTQRHTLAYLKSSCYKPCSNGQCTCSFSRMFFFKPLFSFFFCYSNGGLARKYLYFAISDYFVFLLGGRGSGLCLCLVGRRVPERVWYSGEEWSGRRRVFGLRRGLDVRNVVYSRCEGGYRIFCCRILSLRSDE